MATGNLASKKNRSTGRSLGTGVSPYIFLVLAPLFWAGNFVFGQPLTEALPPFGLNLIRWCVACVVLVPLTLYLEGGIARPPRSLWAGLVLMSITGIFLFNGLVYLSLGYTTSTNAALINGATPILTIVLAAVVGFDKLTGRRVAGALVSLVGIIWVVSRGSLDALASLSFNRGDLIMLVAAVAWAVYTVLVIRTTRVLPPLATTTITALLALPLLVLVGGYDLATQEIGPITPLVVAGLLYVGVVASVGAFLFWNIGVKGVGAARASVFLNLTPVFTVAIAAPTLGERPGLAQLVGGLLVIGGVTLASSKSRKGRNGEPLPKQAA